MSHKKSLGSSPIGFQTTSSSMGFIPDLGVSKSEEKAPKDTQSDINISKADQDSSSTSKEEKSVEKKVVSYNLEVNLISRVKAIASQKDMYYSTLVSMALKRWLADNS